MVREARDAGATGHVISTELEGEARDLGRMLAELTAVSGVGDGAAGGRRVLVGCGGEATVSLGPDGAFGDGGPNQEAAVAAALAFPEGASVCACFLDTDGSDGGTDAAGGIVDGLTARRAAAAGVDLEAALTAHRSGEALERLGDQVVTGPTQTNVNDLFAIAIAGRP
jgi:glycerate 2-kinase